ncbi:MAG: chemotaxis response regulator protein-glutamate methylesterase [FCB group bacterium]|jgi:two-component system chemotaxis response regulator CheB
MEPVRLLIVDDSIFMRQTLVKLLSCDDINVIDTAKNGKEGIEKIIKLEPDVVTLDIEMPIMNGLEALKEIMRIHPVPVIMVSTLTIEGAETTVEALSNGAIDFIAKKAAFGELIQIKDELISKILEIGRNSVLKNMLLRKRLLTRKSIPNELEDSNRQGKAYFIAKNFLNIGKSKANDYSIRRNNRPGGYDIDIIGIGISTGGPNSLHEMIKELPANLKTPILIAQHMPPNFTKSLAVRLNSLTELTVKEAEENEKICPGTIYIAQGGRHMSVARNNRINISDLPPDLLYKPSVDVLMSSISDIFGRRAIGIIMTGMGHDGLEGIRKLSKTGGYIIAQEPDSCVISGMPKSIIDAGLADEIQPLNFMADTISGICVNS